MIVGLTGGIGSGKSEVSRRFEALGVEVIDADLVARQVVEPGCPALSAIAGHFGNQVLQEDGSLDRAQLRGIIFDNSAHKSWLENLLHPIIRIETIKQLADIKSTYGILSSPLLLETNQYQLVDRVLVVDAEEALQIARASARDANAIEQIQKIMATQLTRPQRCARADDIIHNHGDLAELQLQVEKLHYLYLQLASSKPILTD